MINLLALICIFFSGCSINNNLKEIDVIKKIPLEDFFRNPEKSSFQLSPNGEYISYMKPWKEGNRMMNVYVKPINSNKEVRITQASNRSLYGYFWLNNNRIAYIQDKGGDENIHIYAVNIDGSTAVKISGALI